MNTNNNNNFLNIENMLPINLSELDFQFGDDYIVDTRPIRYTRSTCEYRPENDMYDPRMDILTLDPYLTANPVLEAYDARLEQAFMEEDQDNDANLDQVFMEEDQAGDIYCSYHCANLESECENLIATEDAANLDIWMDTENLEETLIATEDAANLDGWMDI